MSPIGMIRNKITSAGVKGAEQIRAAAVRATARNGKEPYAYEEPSEDVLLMQENISERLREGEIPTCFYKKIDCPKPTSEWHYADFAALVEAARAAGKL